MALSRSEDNSVLHRASEPPVLCQSVKKRIPLAAWMAHFYCSFIFSFTIFWIYCVYTKNTLLHAADCNVSFVCAAIYSILSKTPRDPFVIFPRLVIGERLLLLLLARAVESFVRVSCVRFTRSRFFKRATESWGLSLCLGAAGFVALRSPRSQLHQARF